MFPLIYVPFTTMPSIQCTTMDSHAHAVCVPTIETLINENKMPSVSLSRARCPFLLISVIICICHLLFCVNSAFNTQMHTRWQEVAATTRRQTSEQNEQQQQNDCEKCFTHVKYTLRPTTTIPFIRCMSLPLHVNRCDMWIFAIR